MNTPLKLVASVTINIYSDGQQYRTEIVKVEKAEKQEEVVDFFTFFRKVISDYWKNESFGTSKIYENALRSLEKFNSKLKFGDITPEFLKSYERHMTGNVENKDKSVTTLVFYL